MIRRIQKAIRRPDTRRLRIVARDPAWKVRRHILTDEVEIENEYLGPGPRGQRVYIIDYDSTTQTYYRPISPGAYGTEMEPKDPFLRASDDELLQNPAFHAQNVYAIVTRTLSRFEHALGRRISWSFGGHQIAAVPHAFADANAFYSDRDRSLMFGYFPARIRKEMVFSCLSHDVIVHETAHALLDSIRPHYSRADHPDNLAFHEGFADIIALLSVLSLPVVLATGLHFLRSPFGARSEEALVPRRQITMDTLRGSVLLGLAEEMGTELSGVRGDAMRKSLALWPSRRTLETLGREPHRRGEFFVSAILAAFVRIWLQRVNQLPSIGRNLLYRDHVVAEGVGAAERLLATVARALDYAPPLVLTFPAFLSALLTADAEASPDDSRFGVREALKASFAQWGFRPASAYQGGLWIRESRGLAAPTTAPESEDIYRFLYQNWRALGLADGAFTQVEYVRRNQVPAGADRFDVLHEVIAAYTQTLRLRAGALRRYGIRPVGLPEDTEVSLYGGGTLIFAQNGTLKYHVADHLFDAARQNAMVDYVWRAGSQQSRASSNRYAALHRLRQLNLPHTLLDEF